MKKINVFKNYFLAAMSVSLFAVSFANAQQTEGKRAITLAPSTSTQNVKVVNSSAEPVPVAVSGTPTVQVGNTAANPVLMRDVDRSSKTPYNAKILVPIADGQDFVFSDPSLVVPAGKRLVIKYASVDVEVPVGQVVSGSLVVTTQSQIPYQFILNRQASPNGTTDVFLAAQLLEIWLEPGAKINVEINRNSTLGGGGAIVTISGYLENAP
jgi:hypothetical protein